MSFRQEHRTFVVEREFAQEFFDDRVIVRGLWPPRSPDLSPSDFFSWAYLKNHVYEKNPKTLEGLQADITAQTACIDDKMLKNVFQNLIKRV